MRFRTFMIMAVGLMAAAFTYLAPTIAAPLDHAVGIHEASYDVVSFMLPDLALPADRVAVQRDDVDMVLPLNQPLGRALGPVYALSLETHGQSLAAYHLRC